MYCSVVLFDMINLDLDNFYLIYQECVYVELIIYERNKENKLKNKNNKNNNNNKGKVTKRGKTGK